MLAHLYPDESGRRYRNEPVCWSGRCQVRLAVTIRRCPAELVKECKNELQDAGHIHCWWLCGHWVMSYFKMEELNILESDLKQTLDETRHISFQANYPKSRVGRWRFVQAIQNCSVTGCD